MKRSFSQLQTYSTCPKQFEYGYVKKIPRGGISAGESFGTSMHNTLKKWGEAEMQTTKISPVADVRQLHLFTDEEPEVEAVELSLELLLQFWQLSFVVEGYPSRVEATAAKQRGEHILQLYFSWWQQQKSTVLAVEKGFNLPFEHTTLTGRFDRVEQVDGGVRIVDYKTSAPRTQAEVDADLQLSLYALACQTTFGQPCQQLCFLFLRKDGITQVQTSRTQQQLEAAAQTIALIDASILQNIFTATPSETVCKRCPYRNVCDEAVKTT